MACFAKTKNNQNLPKKWDPISTKRKAKHTQCSRILHHFPINTLNHGKKKELTFKILNLNSKVNATKTHYPTVIKHTCS